MKLINFICFSKLFTVRGVFELGSPSRENSFEVLFLGFRSLPILGYSFLFFTKSQKSFFSRKAFCDEDFNSGAI